jgi:hypothetical protein
MIIGDAGQPDDLLMQRLAGILKAGIARQDIIEHALGGEMEGQARQLDDPVAGGIEAGGLDVDDQPEALDGGGIFVGVARHHRDPAEDAVVAALLQAKSHLLQIGAIGHLNLR